MEPRPRRVRVAHAITMLELGGAQQNTLHTVRHLDRSRFEVALIAGPGGRLDGEARAIPDLDLRMVPALRREVRPWHDVRAVRELARLFRELAPDVVHTHSSKAGILGRVAARMAGVPVVVHSVHGFGFTPGQPAPVRAAFFLAERLASPLTTHFVTVSRANLTEGVRSGLFARDRATLVRSGFELAAFRDAPREREAVRRELGFEPDAPLVGMVACLKPQKDPLAFAEVAARVCAGEPRARFVLAGDGVLRGALERRLAALGIAGRVRLAGWRDDVPRLMRALDVLLHTSRWEGLPRVLPQALAAGVPVVATWVDGAPEAVRDGDTGFLSPPRDVPALARAVLRLLADPEAARRMGERGAASVGEFDVAHLVPAQEALYLRLVREAGAAGRVPAAGLAGAAP